MDQKYGRIPNFRSSQFLTFFQNVLKTGSKSWHNTYHMSAKIVISCPSVMSSGAANSGLPSNVWSQWLLPIFKASPKSISLTQGIRLLKSISRFSGCKKEIERKGGENEQSIHEEQVQVKQRCLWDIHVALVHILTKCSTPTFCLSCLDLNIKSHFSQRRMSKKG